MYSPYQTYIPNYGYQNPYQQFNPNLVQQQQPQQNYQATNTNKIFVSGVDDVKSKTIPANSDFIFLDNDKPLLYQKTVDGKGQFEVKTFEIREIKPQEKQKEENTIDLNNYVLKTDFQALQGEIENLKNKIMLLTAVQQKEVKNEQSVE